MTRSQGAYGTSSEYLRELIRQDKDRLQLRALLLAGAASEPAGLAGLADAAYFAGLRQRVQGVDAAGPAALGFIDALEDACAHLARNPATGSLRYAHELNLPALRCWPLTRYPYLIFYVEQPDHIDVWRVLHGRRDIPAGFGGAPALGRDAEPHDGGSGVVHGCLRAVCPGCKSIL